VIVALMYLVIAGPRQTRKHRRHTMAIAAEFQGGRYSKMQGPPVRVLLSDMAAKGVFRIDVTLFHENAHGLLHFHQRIRITGSRLHFGKLRVQ